MAEARTEPSMEEILASIKRIIADDGSSPAVSAPRPRSRPVAVPAAEPLDEPAPGEEPVLELTEAVAPGASEPAPVGPLISDDVASSSRQALAALSALVVKPELGADNSLEGLVREMLRPMLKEWLEARLPDLVESLVAQEIARISGRGL